MPAALEKFTNMPRSRQILLATGAGLAAANYLGGELLWERKGPTTIHPLPYEGHSLPAVGLAFPGMGNIGDGGEKMAQQMSDAVPINQQWASVAYDNSRRLSARSLGECLKRYQEQLGFKYIDLHLSSMGLMMGLAAAKEAGIPIRVMFINSSPGHIKDGYGGRLGNFASKLPIELGLVGKFAGVVVADTIRPHTEAGPGKFRHALHETLYGGSPNLFKNQVRITNELDLENRWEDFRGIIDPAHTIAAYISPYAHEDNTVKVEQSYNRIRKGIGKLGVDVERLYMPGAQHADTEAAIYYGTDWIHKAYREKQHLLLAS